MIYLEAMGLPPPWKIHGSAVLLLSYLSRSPLASAA